MKYILLVYEIYYFDSFIQNSFSFKLKKVHHKISTIKKKSVHNYVIIHSLFFDFFQCRSIYTNELNVELRSFLDLIY